MEKRRCFDGDGEGVEQVGSEEMTGDVWRDGEDVRGR